MLYPGFAAVEVVYPYHVFADDAYVVNVVLSPEQFVSLELSRGLYLIVPACRVLEFAIANPFLSLFLYPIEFVFLVLCPIEFAYLFPCLDILGAEEHGVVDYQMQLAENHKKVYVIFFIHENYTKILINMIHTWRI